MEVLWEIKEKSEHFVIRRDTIADIFGGKKREYLPYKRLYSSLTNEQLCSLINDALENEWEVLDLSNTGIIEWPEELWKLKNLKVLYIGNESKGEETPNPNSIVRIPDGIKELVDLQALSVRGLNLVKVSKNVKSLPKLTYLDCFGCGF